MPTMSMSTRKELLVSIYKRYRFSSKTEKSVILKEFCRSSGYNKKYAIRLLNAPLCLSPKPRPGKKPTYTNEDIYYLKKIWEVLDYPCGQRLKPMMGEMIEVLGRSQELIVPEGVKEHLIKISATTIDRKLIRWKKSIRRRLHGTTKPGSLLKKQIPIVLSRWDEKRPGYTELDLVAHCGMNSSGDFVSTLNLTDLATGWTEEQAILGRAQVRVKEALEAIRERLPFPLRGIDPDNDSGFINWQLFEYCLKEKIEFTRSRPNKKNDNAHIEEKNWTHVRKIVGYERLETAQETALLNELYQGPLRLYMNFFQPQMKLIKKERIGGHLKRVYDQAKTPYQRILENPRISPKKKQELAVLYERLNPVQLKQEVDSKVNLLHSLVKERKKLKKNMVTFSMTERMPVKLHF